MLSVLPANIVDNTVISHGGLTFGGFVTNEEITTGKMLEMFSVTKKFLHENGIVKLIYKCLPDIYFRYPAAEDRYALFIEHGKLIRCDVSTAVYLPNRYKYHKGRKCMVNRGKKNGITVEESREYRAYMCLENNILHKYHQTQAVHSCEEISKLANIFPENIKLYVAKKNGELLAGTIVFINNDVVHTQYMVNSDKGRKLGALDVVIDTLLQKNYCNYRYFDFGISTEQQGRYLNEGLIFQKEGFGGRAIVHDFYELDIE